jgi:hypothetical protein
VHLENTREFQQRDITIFINLWLRKWLSAARSLTGTAPVSGWAAASTAATSTAAATTITALPSLTT